MSEGSVAFTIWLIGCGVMAGLLFAICEIFDIDDDPMCLIGVFIPLWPFVLMCLVVFAPVALIAYVVYCATLYISKVLKR
jgi:hypothetical protein